MTRLISSVILAASLSSAVRGAPACVSQPYSSFIIAGFECEINAAVFSNFSFSSQDSGPNTALDASQITVSPLTFASTVGRLALTSTPAAVRMDPVPPKASSSSSTVFSTRSPAPAANLSAPLCSLTSLPASAPTQPNSATYYPARSLPTAQRQLSTRSGPGLMDTGLLNTPCTLIFVDELLQLSGGASAMTTVAPVGNVTLGSSDNLFTYQLVIPEPSTWFLCLTAIGALLICSRTSKQSRKQ
jgi:hypothetical protein